MLANYVKFMIKNYLFAIISLLFVTVYWISANKLPSASIVFPKSLTYVIILLFIWNFANSIKEFRKLMSTENGKAELSKYDLDINKPKVVVTLITAAYMIFMPIIGFIVSTASYLATLSYYLGVRKLTPLLLFTTIFTGIVYGIFVYWLRIRIPDGFLI